MGVDVDRELTVVVGFKPNDKQIQVAYLARVSGFNDLQDIAKRFNVKAAVIDIEPETRKVRDFQAAERYPVYLCDYLEKATGEGVKWDAERKLVRVNRTEVCDGTHDLVTHGKLILPRRCDEIEVFAKQLTNTAKAIEEDSETGSREYRYRKLGPDHYYHALNYLSLAARKVGVSESALEIYQPRVQAEMDFDPHTYDQDSPTDL